jgi:hypothetical protein
MMCIKKKKKEIKKKICMRKNEFIKIKQSELPDSLNCIRNLKSFKI